MIGERLIDRDSVFRVGRVSSVEGRRVKVSVDRLKNGSHLLHHGSIIRNAAVGGYVKILKGYTTLIAKVDGEYVHENRLRPTGYRTTYEKVARTLEVSLVGFLHDGRFERGIRELPLLDNECYLLDETEFKAVHAFAPEGVPTFRLGVLATEPTQPVDLGIDAIFASHIGIFGNTGSGKSYTLAKLYKEVFERFGDGPRFKQSARFLLVDFNGEYVDRVDDSGARTTEIIAGPQAKHSYELSTRLPGGKDHLPFPKAAIADPVFWTVLLDATERTQAPFVTRVLRSRHWDTLLESPQELMGAVADIVLQATKATDINLDRQTPQNVLREVRDALGGVAAPQLEALINRFQSNLHFHGMQRTYYWEEAGNKTYSDDPRWENLIRSPVAGLSLDFSGIGALDLVQFKLVLQYYEDIVRGFSNREHLSPMIKRLQTRMSEIKKLVAVSDAGMPGVPLVVVSLKDVNLAMRKVVPMLLCKRLYEEKKADAASSDKYLNLIIDEAHNILSTESTRESDAWRDYRLETFEEIVKEGRKFGVFLTIASQRPHDISETIVSQLHNYFLHRLVNNLDIRAIEKAVAYLDAVSFESIPILATGTCVVAGVSAQVPVIVKVGALPEDAIPNSRTMSVAEIWTAGTESGSSSEDEFDR